MVSFRAGFMPIWALAVIVLAACSAGTPSTEPAGQVLFSVTTPNADDCGGTGRVRVRPCPATLTKQKSTIEVTVSGPKVDQAAVVDTACMKKLICTVGQVSSGSLSWWIYNGEKCGSGAIDFYGYDASGQTVGIGKLEIINKDC